MRIFSIVAFIGFLIVGSVVSDDDDDVSEAAEIGDSCTSDDQCIGDNSRCQQISSGCGGGTCVCKSGFALNEVNKTCNPAKKLGQTCNNATTCVTVNSICSAGKCQCADGYKVGLKGDDCMSKLATERYGGSCFDSVQCYYNLACVGKSCACSVGYKFVNNASCEERSVGDSCRVDDDCSKIPNAGCKNGTCQCQTGYQNVKHKYMLPGTLTIATATACLDESETAVGEGEDCTMNNPADEDDERHICMAGFVCTPCSESNNICTRVPTSAAKGK